MDTNNIVTGTGIIKYDPPRPGMNRRTSWWCVATIDNEITNYYRWWLKYEKHIHLDPPSWGGHISIIRGERPAPDVIELWKKYQGKRIEFTYTHGAIRADRSQRTDEHAHKATGGVFYFMDITCPFLDDIRSELGLRIGFNYHFTVGRTHEYDARIPKNLRNKQ